MTFKKAIKSLKNLFIYRNDMLIGLLILIPFASIIVSYVWKKNKYRICIYNSILLVVISIINLAVCDAGLERIMFSFFFFILDFTSDKISATFVFFSSLSIFFALILDRKFFSKNLNYVYLLYIFIGLIILAFLSNNILIFFIFAELSTLCLHIIIELSRKYKQVSSGHYSLLIYNSTSSVLFLIFTLFITFQSSILQIDSIKYIADTFSDATRALLSFGITVVFFIRLGMFPFHRLYVDAGLHARVGLSIILFTSATYVSYYGLLKLALPFYNVAYLDSVYLYLYLAFGIIYLALLSLKQKNIKTIISYFGIYNSAFVIIYLFSANHHGIHAAILQIIAQGLLCGGFIILLNVLYKETNTYDIICCGDLARKMPVFSKLFLILIFFSIGAPGTIVFSSKIIGIMSLEYINVRLSILICICSAIPILYMLRLANRLLYLKSKADLKINKDIGVFEKRIVILLIIIMIYFGIFPNSFFGYSNIEEMLIIISNTYVYEN